VVGTVFRLAVSTLRAKDDPTLLLRGALKAPKVQHRAAITDEKHPGALLVAIDAYDGWGRHAVSVKAIDASRCWPQARRYQGEANIKANKFMRSGDVRRCRLRRRKASRAENVQWSQRPMGLAETS
jgi:hypothetical protein